MEEQYCSSSSGSSSLFLSGGGMKVVAFLGALELLPWARREHIVSGVSAGALLALLLAVGYSPAELQRLLLEEDWNRHFAESFSFARLARGAAPASQAFVRACLARWLRAKGLSARVTFAQLAARGARLRCVAADLDGGALRAFDARATPDVPAAQAALAAMAVPLYFRPVEIGGRRYVDAALVNNTPLSLCPERPLLALVTHCGAPCLGGWERCLALPKLRLDLLGHAELLCLESGSRVVHMPEVSEEVHLFRADEVSVRALLQAGRLGVFAALRPAPLLALLALLLLRLPPPPPR
jgi:hypothetical protein